MSGKDVVHAGHEPQRVERVSGSGLSVRDFVEKFADPGVPVLLLDVVPAWRAFAEWRLADGSPNYGLLGRRFGESPAPVVDCGPRPARSWEGIDASEEVEFHEDEARPTQTWRAGRYFAWAATQRRTGGSEGPSATAQGVADEVDDDSEGRLLYLKDWHFVQACRNAGLEVPYNAPDYLAAPLHDWLNLWADVEHTGKEDFDYRFCYAGVAGTSTPLHHDVLWSHSWSASICGRKRWALFQPSLTSCLLDRRGEAAHSAKPGRRPVDWERRFPHLDEAWAQRLEVIQEPGELMFVPSGWYHEVENVDDAVSINHNWFNASNAMGVWRFLQKELSSAKEAIEDCRESFDSPEEFETHCQRLMRANCGLDYGEWLGLLAVAASEAAQEKHRVELEGSRAGCCVSSTAGGRLGINEATAHAATHNRAEERGDELAGEARRKFPAQPNGVQCHPNFDLSCCCGAVHDSDSSWAVQWALRRIREVAASTLSEAVVSQFPKLEDARARLCQAIDALGQQPESHCSEVNM